MSRWRVSGSTAPRSTAPAAEGRSPRGIASRRRRRSRSRRCRAGSTSRPKTRRRRSPSSSARSKRKLPRRGRRRENPSSAARPSSSNTRTSGPTARRSLMPPSSTPRRGRFGASSMKSTAPSSSPTARQRRSCGRGTAPWSFRRRAFRLLCRSSAADDRRLLPFARILLRDRRPGRVGEGRSVWRAH